MEQVEQEMEKWLETGRELELPAWEELPAIPLYMDQVILYLRECLSFFQQDENSPLLTSSMINNYVKNGVLPHPDKKKYRKEHLGALMAVCMLKQVLSIQELKTLLDGQEIGPELYELFREAQTGAVQETCRSLQGSKANLKREALRLAAEANAKRCAAQQILHALESDD